MSWKHTPAMAGERCVVDKVQLTCEWVLGFLCGILGISGFLGLLAGWLGLLAGF